MACRDLSTLLLLVSFPMLLACGPAVEVDTQTGADGSATEDGSGSTDGSTGTATMTSPGTLTVSTTSPTTTGPDADATSFPTSDPTVDPTTGDTESGACAPGPVSGEFACESRGPTQAGFEFPYEAFFGEAPVSCTVAGGTDNGEWEDVFLDCEGFDIIVTLSIRTVDPHQNVLLSDEETVLVEYRLVYDSEVPDRYLTIRDEFGNLRFAAIEAVNVPGPDIIDLSPLELDVVTSDCPGKRAGEFCVVVQRTGLQVTYDDSTVVVFDGHHDFAGSLTSYEVFAQMVEREVCWPDECGINYYTWGVYALFFLIPEG